jgi:hypothetical protein
MLDLGASCRGSGEGEREEMEGEFKTEVIWARLRFEDRGILGGGKRYLRRMRLFAEGVKKLAENPETTGRRWTDIEEQYALGMGSSYRSTGLIDFG